MQFDIVLLPLLGGYIFTTKWYHTRFYLRRQSGYRLLFASAISGALFLFLSLILTHIFPTHYADWPITQKITGPWDKIFGQFEYLGSTFLAFLLGAITWSPLNYVGYDWMKKYRKTECLEWRWLRLNPAYGEGKAEGWGTRVKQFFLFCKHSKQMNCILKEIHQSNNGFEVILFDAFVNQKIVSVTTDYNKVYIGFVLSTFNPGKEQYAIRLLPLISGYRDDKTKSVHLNTNYIKVFTELIKDRKSPREEVEEGDFEMIFNEFGNYQLALKYQQINSINYFEDDVFKKFEELQRGK